MTTEKTTELVVVMPGQEPERGQFVTCGGCDFHWVWQDDCRFDSDGDVQTLHEGWATGCGNCGQIGDFWYEA